LIIENELVELVKYQDVPEEKSGKILVLLKCRLEQHAKITMHKAMLVMDGSLAQNGIDVFDTYAPMIYRSRINQSWVQ
jgi:hypothetical protein